MTIIQIFLIAFVAAALLSTVARFRHGALSGLQLILWSILWTAIGVVAVRPETTSALARFFGVGRGADLIVYLALLAIFYLQFRTFARMERIEREITSVVRKDALEKIDREKDAR